jgi:hypothetical protein
MTPKVAFGLIEKPIGSALRATGTFDTMKKLVRDKSPAELYELYQIRCVSFDFRRESNLMAS